MKNLNPLNTENIKSKGRMLSAPAWTSVTVLIALFIALFVALPAYAQDATPTPEPTPDTGIWVTTQDNMVLREGPGLAFARVDGIPFATTLPAIGRTVDGTWIQVYYNGKTGWLNALFLIWSGDMISLPADGINPAPYVRQRGVVFLVNNTMAIYNQENYGPGQPVTFPVESAAVEITARLGAGDSFWLQFWYAGEYYWLGDWNLHLNVSGGYFDDVPDASYVYPFGRLYGKIVQAYETAINRFYAINSLWNTLAGGESITCGSTPANIESTEISQEDLNAEAVFIPTVRALEAAIISTNSAIERLRTACSAGGEDRFLTTETVDAALADLTEAERNFNLLGVLLPPIANRDPALGG